MESDAFHRTRATFHCPLTRCLARSTATLLKQKRTGAQTIAVIPSLNSCLHAQRLGARDPAQPSNAAPSLLSTIVPMLLRGAKHEIYRKLNRQQTALGQNQCNSTSSQSSPNSSPARSITASSVAAARPASSKSASTISANSPTIAIAPWTTAPSAAAKAWS